MHIFRAKKGRPKQKKNYTLKKGQAHNRRRSVGLEEF